MRPAGATTPILIDSERILALEFASFAALSEERRC
jgi:hypothetical protein